MVSSGIARVAREVSEQPMLHEMLNVKIRAGTIAAAPHSVQDMDGRLAILNAATMLYEAPRFTLRPDGVQMACVECSRKSNAEHGLQRCVQCLEPMCADGECKHMHAKSGCSKADYLKIHGLRKAGLLE